jgi:hypothetical protein
MSKNKLFFSLIAIFFSLINVSSQVEKKSIPLKNILKTISAEHNIIFNYIEDEIAVFSLIPPNKELSLLSKIDYIKTETKLKFTANANRYYTIYNDTKLDKPLCGYLIDRETNEPIENAVIIISKSQKTTWSNANGYFELPKISSNTIEIKHVSYEFFEINPEELSEIDCPKLNLTPLAQNLEEAIVQRYLTSGISKKNNGTFEVKPKKFGILPGLIEPDVLQTMQQIPGIYSVDETISNINVRGGTHDQNLFLWNGIRMFQTGHFFGLISAFNPSLAQTISISKNGTSAFMGESVSSMIAIDSHSKTIENKHQSISANLISAEFYSKIKVSDKATFEFSGRRSFADAFSSPTYKNYRNRIFQNTIVTTIDNNQTTAIKSDEKFYFYDFTAQYQQKVGEKNELFIDIIAIENSLIIDQTATSISKESNLGQQNFGGNMSWKTNWNANNTSKIHFYSSYYNLDATNKSLQNNQVLKQHNTVLDYGFQIKNTHQISKVVTFLNGYQFNEIGVTNFDEINLPFFSRKIKEVLRNHAIIGEGIFQSENKKTYLCAGIRANYFEKFSKSIIEPRIQFNQSLSNSLHLEILGEQKNQSLSQIIDLQGDFLGIEKRRWTLSNNQNIPIQKSNQFSIGFTFKNNNWLITLENFYKKITGITSNSQGFQNQFEYVKSKGSYEILGSEILVQKNFNRFYTWVSYSFNDNKYSFETLDSSQFPNNFELVHTVSWAGIYEWEKLKFALGSKWNSGKPITTPKSNIVDATDVSNPIINYNDANNSRLKEYFQLNFSASKSWNLSPKVVMQTSFSILNILNTKNIINKYYRVDSSNNSIESVATYSLERTPNLNIKVSF